MTLFILRIGVFICSILLSGLVNNRSSSLGARLGLHCGGEGKKDW